MRGEGHTNLVGIAEVAVNVELLYPGVEAAWEGMEDKQFYKGHNYCQSYVLLEKREELRLVSFINILTI